MAISFKQDLEEVSLCATTIDNICANLQITTSAGREFVIFALANARLVDRKQKDYGPHNIAKVGSYGCLVRASDKLERLFTLFKSKRKKPQNESIVDSYRDLSNYAIIALMCEEGKWPNS